MHFLPTRSLLAFALCNCRLHSDADSDLAWKYTTQKFDITSLVDAGASVERGGFSTRISRATVVYTCKSSAFDWSHVAKSIDLICNIRHLHTLVISDEYGQSTSELSRLFISPSRIGLEVFTLEIADWASGLLPRDTVLLLRSNAPKLSSLTIRRCDQLNWTRSDQYESLTEVVVQPLSVDQLRIIA